VISALNISRYYSYAEITEIRRDRREDFKSLKDHFSGNASSCFTRLQHRRQTLSCDLSPREEQHQTDYEAHPPHSSVFKNYGRVEQDEDYEPVPRGNDGPGPGAVGSQTTDPPPGDVRYPHDQERVINVQTAGPVETDNFFCLPSGFAKRRRLAPVVEELICANEVSY